MDPPPPVRREHRKTQQQEVTKADVLAGRDSLAHGHPGNVFFRHICKKHRHQYQKAKFRSIKSAVINSVVAAVKQRQGRFMTLQVSKGENGEEISTWVEMDADAIHQKVSHNLRNCFRGGSSSGSKSPPQLHPPSPPVNCKPKTVECSTETLQHAPDGRTVKSFDVQAIPRKPRTAPGVVHHFPFQSAGGTPYDLDVLAAVCAQTPASQPSSSTTESSHLDDSQQLYLFDAPFRQHILCPTTENPYQVFPVTFQIVQENNAEIHRANLIVLPHS